MSIDDGLDSTIQYFKNILENTVESPNETYRINKIKSVTEVREKQERLLKEQIKKQQEIIEKFKQNSS